jgi:hypothetical protein
MYAVILRDALMEQDVATQRTREYAILVVGRI